MFTAGPLVVSPLLPSSADSIVNSLSAKVVGCRLPRQPTRTPVGTFGPACLDELLGHALATRALGNKQVVHDADPGRLGGRPGPVQRGESRHAAAGVPREQLDPLT